MRRWSILLFLCSLSLWAQNKPTKTVIQSGSLINKSSLGNTVIQRAGTNNNLRLDSLKLGKTLTSVDTVAKIEMYEIRDVYNNSISVDTTLTIKKYYANNFLRRDNFGLLAFNNDGQTYNTLDHGLRDIYALPQTGFSARMFAYLRSEDIFYYHVPTAFSELYYRSAISQGQNLDALFTVNTSEKFNFFVGYKGLRSLGSYINQLTSVGNFRIGASYLSKNKRYGLKTHFAFQDIGNQENGGITDPVLFEANQGIYKNRERLNVFFRDANSYFKGLRLYFNHNYRFVKSLQNDLWIGHESIYEYKTNFYTQVTPNPTNYFTSLDGTRTQINNYFGETFSGVRDKVRHYNLYNKFALGWTNKQAGRLSFFIDHTGYDYHYRSQVFDENGNVKVPSKLAAQIATIGGEYFFQHQKFDASVMARQTVVGETLSEIKGAILGKITKDVSVLGQYEFVSKIPDFTQRLFQSAFVPYNWYNEFSNEKHSRLRGDIQTPWFDASVNYHLITDKIYFSNDATTVDSNNRLQQLLATPKQYNGVINYFGVKLSREFTFGKFALDNTILYQQVIQDQSILNVPVITTRNTFYYTDYWFKKALFLQIGLKFSYFSKYYADGYAPIIGDFYIQNQQKIGGYPVFDVFVNAKIRTARVFISVDHFNAKWTSINYYTAPNYPYQELTFRFGLVWDLFN